MWKYIIPLVIIAMAVAAFYNGIIIRHYIINTKIFNNGQSIRAVLISDLHDHIFGGNQKKLISKITKQKPDVILLAGDIADDIGPIEGTKLLLSGIKDIAPVFYVSGNHEYWSGDIEKIKKTIRSF